MSSISFSGPIRVLNDAKLVLRDIGRVCQSAADSASAGLDRAIQIAQSAAQIPSNDAIPSVMATPSLHDHSESLEQIVHEQLLKEGFSLPEATSLAAIGTLKTLPFTIPHEESQSVQEAIGRLEVASPFEKELARDNLFKVVENANSLVFFKELESVVERVCSKVGHDVTERIANTAGELCLTAVSQEGAILGCEIRIDAKGNTSIATEPVNVGWPDCEDLMNRFDAALQEELPDNSPVRKRSARAVVLQTARDLSKPYQKPARKGTPERLIKRPRQRSALK